MFLDFSGLDMRNTPEYDCVSRVNLTKFPPIEGLVHHFRQSQMYAQIPCCYYTQTNIATHIWTFIPQDDGRVSINVDRSTSICIVEDITRMTTTLTSASSRPPYFLGRLEPDTSSTARRTDLPLSRIEKGKTFLSHEFFVVLGTC